ncbi:hypothetical protein GNF10_28555 [Nostoc sp. UCD121]|uniref:hypothetical protein n=1 Tax=unclassified Nostoc TaxID=2593658 RepID=UPI001624BDEA|nr:MULTISPECIES: hypothetical protein [unclassified Nostoc]MBC1220980.1 hypothetical protein [Nostoc sp. UCD120]MBC1279800.1 hypothetical protein [Nostoc sp. UCD121]MBC1297999.1 hypothetical protein [Nostoc sp. UCD122]
MWGSLFAAFVSFGEALSFPYRRPRPHPCSCYNHASTADDCSPWGNGAFMLKGECVQFVPKIWLEQ